MIKVILHKIFTILLALFVLLSTVSFTVKKHYCGNVLVDASIFAEAETCEMETFEELQSRGCCKDEVQLVKGQDELKMSLFDHVEFEQQKVLVSFVFSYINLFKILEKEVVPHKNYAPPNLVNDIQVLNNTFLI